MNKHKGPEVCAAWTCLSCGKTWISATGWTLPAYYQSCGKCGSRRYRKVSTTTMSSDGSGRLPHVAGVRAKSDTLARSSEES